MKFREDINSLRAIAVISVVIFHFDHSWVPGGFAGVDIFFVISGFLMTMIIVNGLDKGNFSVLSFYAARVRRIIPALAILCFTLLCLGYFLLSPIDYSTLGKHAAASLTFTSNIVYWTESNYFNAASLEKWLLHTWSLSVEWQFYLIYPLVLIGLKKFLSIKHIKLILLVSTALAFTFSVFVTFKSSSAAYFLLPTRAWQMLAGALVFFYPIKLEQKHQTGVQLIGLFLIFVSFFIFDSSTPWPGYASLLPILGACLVLTANDSLSSFSRSKILKAIGKWSYSIYLWHWPIVVAGTFFNLSSYWWLFGIPLSLLLGAASFKFIESKRLADYGLSKVKIFFAPISFACIVVVGGIVVFSTDGIIQRLSKGEQLLVRSAIQAKDDWNYPKSNREINTIDIRYINGTSEENVLIIGASHIEQLYPYFDNGNNYYNIYFLTQSGCLVTPSMKNPKWDCHNLQNYDLIFDEIKFEKIVTSFYSIDSYLSKDLVVREQQMDQRLNEYDTFLAKLKSEANNVYLILGEPRGDAFDPVKAIRENLPRSISEKQARSEYIIHNNALSKLTQLNDIEIIDPIQFLCSDDVCKTRDENSGFFTVIKII